MQHHDVGAAHAELDALAGQELAVVLRGDARGQLDVADGELHLAAVAEEGSGLDPTGEAVVAGLGRPKDEGLEADGDGRRPRLVVAVEPHAEWPADSDAAVRRALDLAFD